MKTILDTIASLVVGKIVRSDGNKPLLVEDVVPSGDKLIFVGVYQDGSKAIWNCPDNVWGVQPLTVMEFFISLLPTDALNGVFIGKFGGYPKSYVFISDSIVDEYSKNVQKRVYRFLGDGYSYQVFDTKYLEPIMNWLDEGQFKVNSLPIGYMQPHLEVEEIDEIIGGESLRTKIVNPEKPYNNYKVEFLYDGNEYAIEGITRQQIFSQLYDITESRE